MKRAELILLLAYAALSLLELGVIAYSVLYPQPPTPSLVTKKQFEYYFNVLDGFPSDGGFGCMICTGTIYGGDCNPCGTHVPDHPILYGPDGDGGVWFYDGEITYGPPKVLLELRAQLRRRQADGGSP